jgi:hypothetical protein
MTIFRSNKPGQRTGLPRREAAALRCSPLVCRDYGQPCRRREAIRGHRQVLKCPHCGGLLDRQRTNEGGSAQ